MGLRPTLSTQRQNIPHISGTPKRPANDIKIVSCSSIIYPPANTLGEPAATAVQPLIPSPTLPHPNPFTFTVLEPLVIGAACDGHGDPGKRCTVFLSVWRETGIPFAYTLPEAPDLTGVEQ
jgi:hypothetical protein